MKPLCTLIVIVAALVAAAPAAAQVTVEGSGEPAFTNSTQNTQWVGWPSQSSAIDAYRLHIRYYRDGVQVHELRTSVSKDGGSGFWMNWEGVATLQEGSTYAICVRGEYSLDNDSLYFPDGQDSCTTGNEQGKRTATTIDRTKPTVSIAAAGGADSTKDGSIPLSIGFQDATAGPYPATFLCVTAGADPCESGYGYSPECSVPSGGGKSTTFNCTADASGLPDGPVTVCAIGADASVPDNPNSANQTRNASQANRSDAKCDTVVLDRTAPVTQDPPADGGSTPQQPTQPTQPSAGDPVPGGIRIGAVTVSVPKRVKLGKLKQLVLGAHADQAGQLTLRLTRGKRVYSRRVALLAAGTSKQRLRLPKGLKAGTYAVKIAFKAAGASWEAAGRAKVVLRKG